MRQYPLTGGQLLVGAFGADNISKRTDALTLKFNNITLGQPLLSLSAASVRQRPCRKDIPGEQRLD